MLRLATEGELPGPAATPRPGECVVCFVERMTRAYGCSGRLLWAELWRDRCAPNATALAGRLGRKGGYCDCEVLMNAFVRQELFWSRISRTWTEEDERFEAQEPPACGGVRRGSSQACQHWVTRHRGTW